MEAWLHRNSRIVTCRTTVEAKTAPFLLSRASYTIKTFDHKGRDAPSTDPFAPTSTNIQSPSRARRESGSNATAMSGTASKFSPSTRLVLTQQQRHNIF
ncbi:hypothetical protein Pst134EA_009704 [Puccinia striiformis f. sp. tritici]|uniref:hypothetical protein n=1 Tax=Puccinia striiformis f. sp. tritici TaxID=168172 RepID=UPI002008E87A|nr:hypothetical protein Pst134EA_009704 [Puccinia striiformis f. sp. tritici]KAH9469175.1 hypothetical protein Pst134EA_009704 [Puccinia striiformis f. sp. tritici]